MPKKSRVIRTLTDEQAKARWKDQSTKVMIAPAYPDYKSPQTPDVDLIGSRGRAAQQDSEKSDEPKGPLLIARGTGQLSTRPQQQANAYAMVRRRARAAGIGTARQTVITYSARPASPRI